MNAELANRNKDLPAAVKKNLERVLSNLVMIQEMLGVPSKAEPALQADLEPSAKKQNTEQSILLIDDSIDLRSLFLAILQPRGYKILTAKDLTEATTLIQTNPPFNLVLLDFQLETQTGIDVLDAFQKMSGEFFIGSKVVLFTGFGDHIADVRAHAVEQKALDIPSVLQLVAKYCPVN
jgi:CheY-like chemotaxis protein